MIVNLFMHSNSICRRQSLLALLFGNNIGSELNFPRNVHLMNIPDFAKYLKGSFVFGSHLYFT